MCEDLPERLYVSFDVCMSSMHACHSNTFGHAQLK